MSYTPPTYVPLAQLIDKLDASEIVGLRIAEILHLEQENQQTLAANAGKPDPELWKLRVFYERSNPWQEYQNPPVVDQSPIVNVWWESSNFPKSTGSGSGDQQTEGFFNVDCYGYAESEATAEGHAPGDKGAALVAKRAARLCRNILMALQNSHFQLGRKLVQSRWLRDITWWQPADDDGRPVQNVVAGRLRLDPKFNESAQEWQGATLDKILVGLILDVNGELRPVADLEIDT